MLNEVWVANDGTALLDVTLTVDYTMEYEVQLPDTPIPEAT